MRSTSDIQCRVVTRRLDEIFPRPSYVGHGLSVSASQLSALVSLGDLALRQPIIITRNSTIIDGYGRFQLARQLGREAIVCLEYDLSEEETLRWLIRSRRPSRGLNAFNRVLLALDLEPTLQEAARANKPWGGQNKGSSNLTEAQRVDLRSQIAVAAGVSQGKGSSNLTEAGRVDVRTEIAAAAGVSAGNVTKVKRLMKSATVEVLQALRNGDISIHRAWLWSQEAPEKQRDALWRYQSENGVKKTIRNLLRRQRTEDSPVVLSVDSLARRLSTLDSSEGPIRVVVTDVPGRAVFLTEELFRTIGAQEELTLK